MSDLTQSTIEDYQAELADMDKRRDVLLSRCCDAEAMVVALKRTNAELRAEIERLRGYTGKVL